MEGTIIGAVMAVFTAILTWFQTSMTTVSNLFYAEGELTLIGVMAVLGLGIGVFTVVVAIIRSLIKARG